MERKSEREAGEIERDRVCWGEVWVCRYGV
jgi:hypothetical protein